MKRISERHEVRVEANEHTYVFLADPQAGRLEIRDEAAGEGEACSLVVESREDLMNFFDGLRRVLGSARREADAPVQARRQLGDVQRDGEAGEVDREQIINSARRRNPQAFAPWTRDEEADVRRRYEAGESFAEIGRNLKRSARAIEMRLKRMGALENSD